MHAKTPLSLLLLTLFAQAPENPASEEVAYGTPPHVEELSNEVSGLDETGPQARHLELLALDELRCFSSPEGLGFTSWDLSMSR